MNTTRCSCPTCRGVPPRPAPLPSVRSEILLTVVICVIWALMFLAVLGYMDMADARVGGLASELKR